MHLNSAWNYISMSGVDLKLNRYSIVSSAKGLNILPVDWTLYIISEFLHSLLHDMKVALIGHDETTVIMLY